MTFLRERLMFGLRMFPAMGLFSIQSGDQIISLTSLTKQETIRKQFSPTASWNL